MSSKVDSTAGSVKTQLQVNPNDIVGSLTVDWADGTVDVWVEGVLSGGHAYTDDGLYMVVVTDEGVHYGTVDVLVNIPSEIQDHDPDPVSDTGIDQVITFTGEHFPEGGLHVEAYDPVDKVWRPKTAVVNSRIPNEFKVNFSAQELSGPSIQVRIVEQDRSSVPEQVSIIHTGVGRASPPPLTGILMGTPGSFVPVDADDIPRGEATMRSNLVIGDAAYASVPAWKNGEYITVGASATRLYWDGTTWQTGTAPNINLVGVTAGAPGSFAPLDAFLPSNLAALKADAAVGDSGTSKPTTAWSAGEYVLLGTDKVSWSGTAWVVGAAS